MTLNDEIFEKLQIIENLLMKVHDVIFIKFFDFDSLEMLDDKISVLTDLADGKLPCEIPMYYKVLEKYPKEGHWD